MEPKSLKISQKYDRPNLRVLCYDMNDNVLSASTENIAIDNSWTWDE